MPPQREAPSWKDWEEMDWMELERKGLERKGLEGQQRKHHLRSNTALHLPEADPRKLKPLVRKLLLLGLLTLFPFSTCFASCAALGFTGGKALNVWLTQRQCTCWTSFAAKTVSPPTLCANTRQKFPKASKVRSKIGFSQLTILKIA